MSLVMLAVVGMVCACVLAHDAVSSMGKRRYQLLLIVAMSLGVVGYATARLLLE